MNGQLSFESVNVCHTGKMQSRPLDPRKPMLLLAGCLMVASVVPMFVVIAAG